MFSVYQLMSDTSDTLKKSAKARKSVSCTYKFYKTMAAVVRLKRHLDDEPLGALILNCKKRKRSINDSESEISTVLKFAGTLTTQTDDISSHISKLTKEDLKKTYKKHVPNVTSKIRQQRKEAAENSRFKVVNFIRSIDHELNSLEYSTDEDKQLALTVLDVETEVEANGEKTVTDESDYVYDLYYTNSEGIDDTEFDSEFRVCPANEIIFDTYEDGIGMASDHDSDDSNDENNWRNDYPDEDDDDDDEEQDDDTIDENDMRKAMDCLSLNGDTLSSDDGEEGFSYSIDSEAVGCEEDLDHSDARRYGEMYARFKAKQKKEEEKYNKDLYHDEVDDTDDDFYDQ